MIVAYFELEYIWFGLLNATTNCLIDHKSISLTADALEVNTKQQLKCN